jgi:hypothetical protein
VSALHAAEDIARSRPGKCVWTLTHASGDDVSEFRQRLLDELAGVVTKLVPTAAEVYVTLQEQAAYSGALVDAGAGQHPVDAALELLTSEDYVGLDELHAHLRSTCGHVQGWRVKPTLIYDSAAPRSVGEPSLSPNVLVFVERLDGTTPEHFSRNWYIHAGHLDGDEAESEESIAERRREEAEGPGRCYRQNRVLEPITPTAWLLHGYTQLQMGFLVPPVDGEPYARVRGEEPFDRWPPRILQGFEYRVL